MEDFVSYELAVKLKEKGFPQVEKNTLAMYDEDGCISYLCPTLDINKCYYIFDDFDEDDCVCPTISQVLKWLRKEKDIDLVISPVFFYDDVLGKIREYGCKVFTPSLNKPEHCGYHKKWELASLAGIKYVIDNLI